ncbi:MULTISPECIES: DedA family protein [unclassified Saccharopolyspora]|uniref:DedA family protein n=1 Tax=unclassified Saccharopolyspora TaxID=2646250 RepID=UPI001CD6705F|nr:MULTISPECIES: VTT domain-containing protein [unclassified Saccharopolyspora]MCA1188560.1 VTT domain-containing protein [Saccharopolyspora sp. 6T]MCA1279667.1 VTT domain-containing protein [Saccharopolyspora sp. 7B]
MVEHVMGLPVPALLVVAAVVLVLESGSPLGVLLPGSPMLLALGLLSRQGVVPLWVAVPVAGAASALGCQWAFLRARRLRLLDADADLLEPPGRWERGLIRRAGPERVRRSLSLLERRAVPAVAGAHFVSVLRTLMPRLAGRAGVAHLRFCAASVPAAFTWAAVVCVLGRVAGEAYGRVSAAVGVAGAPLVVLAALGAGAVLLVRRRRAARVARSGTV